MIKKLKNIPLSWSLLSQVLYFAVLAAIIIFTFVGDSGLYQLHQLTGNKRSLMRQINETKARIEQLEKEKILLTTPAYLESIIRKELGYIRTGEVVYQVTSEQ